MSDRDTDQFISLINKIRNNRFTAVVSIVYVAVFLTNLVLSLKYNIIMIILTGGGQLVDFLGASRNALINELQLYRLITYGYLHPAIWHLIVNIFALWYVGIYIGKKLSKAFIVIIYHAGLVVPCIVFLMIFPNEYMYGASPAIFCFLGIMVMWLIKDRELLDEYKKLQGYRYLLYYMIFSNFLSLGTFVVHFSGFCLGLLLGLVVKRKRDV